MCVDVSPPPEIHSDKKERNSEKGKPRKKERVREDQGKERYRIQKGIFRSVEG